MTDVATRLARVSLRSNDVGRAAAFTLEDLPASYQLAVDQNGRIQKVCWL